MRGFAFTFDESEQFGIGGQVRDDLKGWTALLGLGDKVQTTVHNFDGNGRRDLLRSAPDVLASTANYLAAYGWKRGKDWEPGGANFAVIQQWNKSEVYARTVAYFASQLARSP